MRRFSSACQLIQLSTLKKGKMADLSLARNELELFRYIANDAIHFKLVRRSEDIDDDADNNGFLAEMTHQFFGDSEMLFGYIEPRVDLYYTAAKLIPYLHVSYKRIVDEKEYGVPPDDVAKTIVDTAEMQSFCTTNLNAFRSAVEDDLKFKTFGEKVDEYSLHTKSGAERQFEVYFVKIEEPGFREFHRRLQTFIKFFIDAASYIDVDDESWDFFIVLEKYKEVGDVRYAVAAYMTTYNFYAYPSCVRPRISQVLVLPPFQRMGLCARMVQTFYNRCYSRSEVIDITVEDPSENFQRVRDFVDCKNCLKLASFSPEELRKGFSQQMVHDTRRKLKLSKLQTRRVYEILRLKATDENDKEMLRGFRLDVKRRLNIPFLKNRRTFQKLQNCLNNDELSQTLGVMKKEQKFQYLEKMYQEEIQPYRTVVDRLNNRSS